MILSEAKTAMRTAFGFQSHQARLILCAPLITLHWWITRFNRTNSIMASESMCSVLGQCSNSDLHISDIIFRQWGFHVPVLEAICIKKDREEHFIYRQKHCVYFAHMLYCVLSLWSAFPHASEGLVLLSFCPLQIVRLWKHWLEQTWCQSGHSGTFGFSLRFFHSARFPFSLVAWPCRDCFSPLF